MKKTKRPGRLKWAVSNIIVCIVMVAILPVGLFLHACNGDSTITALQEWQKILMGIRR